MLVEDMRGFLKDREVKHFGVITPLYLLVHFEFLVERG
jgi:hypothetical protein